MKNQEIVRDQIKEKLKSLANYCNIAEFSANNTLIAIKNLDELHRLHMQGIKPAWDLANIRDLINKAIAAAPYRDSGIKVEISIDKDVPPEIVLDKENIKKSLSIVIGNAFRFSTPPDHIKISCMLNKKGENLLLISVQDFGVGIHKMQLDNLFSSVFSEEEGDIKSHYMKPSVQLSQVKLRMEASGGDITILSTEKNGTTVVLDVPFKASNKEKKIASRESYIFNPKNLHILLIEDTPSVQQTIRTILENEGFHVTTADTAAQGIKLASENHHDLVLMDLTLPDMNGIEATHILRKKYGENLPVIAVTSHATEEDADNCIDAGIPITLAKPVKKEELLRSISLLLNTMANLHDEDD